MRGMFQHIEGAAVITVEAGVFKQTSVFHRSGFLYAKSGSGFVRLYADGSTTKAKCRYEDLHVDEPYNVVAYGHLKLQGR